MVDRRVVSAFLAMLLLAGGPGAAQRASVPAPARGATPAAGAQAGPTPAELADPFLGVDGGGNTVPGAAVPFGFVELSPETEYPSTNGVGGSGRRTGSGP